MSESSGNPFLKKQSHGDDHGEGNWLVSYADMMTLLVGFFVILLSFSTIDAEKLEDAKKSVTQEFGGSYQQPFEEIVKRLKEALDKAGLGDQFVIKQSDDGVEISFSGTVFFESGSVDLKSEAISILDSMIQVVKKDTTDFDVKIEGHTDDVPLGAGSVYKNNFELSSIRACRVLDIFLKNGFHSDRMTAIGYGEVRPIVPNRDESGMGIPINQAKNRRVVLKLTQSVKDSLVDFDPEEKTNTAPKREPVDAIAPGESKAPDDSTSHH